MADVAARVHKDEIKDSKQLPDSQDNDCRIVDFHGDDNGKIFHIYSCTLLTIVVLRRVHLSVFFLQPDMKVPAQNGIKSTYFSFFSLSGIFGLSNSDLSNSSGK